MIIIIGLYGLFIICIIICMVCLYTIHDTHVKYDIKHQYSAPSKLFLWIWPYRYPNSYNTVSGYDVHWHHYKNDKMLNDCQLHNYQRQNDVDVNNYVQVTVRPSTMIKTNTVKIAMTDTKFDYLAWNGLWRMDNCYWRAPYTSIYIYTCTGIS